jgi:hypothetical protein
MVGYVGVEALNIVSGLGVLCKEDDACGFIA